MGSRSAVDLDFTACCDFNCSVGQQPDHVGGAESCELRLERVGDVHASRHMVCVVACLAHWGDKHFDSCFPDVTRLSSFRRWYRLWVFCLIEQMPRYYECVKFAGRRQGQIVVTKYIDADDCTLLQELNGIEMRSCDILFSTATLQSSILHDPH